MMHYNYNDINKTSSYIGCHIGQSEISDNKLYNTSATNKLLADFQSSNINIRNEKFIIYTITTASKQIQDFPLSWLKLKPYPEIIKLLLSVDKINDAKSLLPYYKNIHNLLINQNYTICNSILKEIEVSKSTEVISTGLLRLTSSWKKNLPYWDNYLQKVKNELDKRHLNTNELLIGLL